MNSPLPRARDSAFRRALVLVADTLRLHRVAALVWLLLGGLMMYGLTVAVGHEMARFPGGPAALAATVAAGAEVMRPLRWPAERLDTLGGYATFHNVLMMNLALALYGAVQGVQALRGSEERHVAEELLATGHSRLALLRDRTIGFALLMVLVALGLAFGTAAGLSQGGAPDLAGSLVTLGTSGLVGLVGYALGLLVSQFTPRARTASGLASGILVVLYVVTNMGEKLGPASVLRFVSPFHHANASRALLPGGHLDVASTLFLLGLVLLFVGLAGAAFVRRDLGAPLWTRRARGDAARVTPIPTRMLGSVWTSILRRHRFGLLFWALGAGGTTALLASLQPAILEMWSKFDFIAAMTGQGPGITAEAAYWSFSGELLLPVIAAFVIVQASGWVAELEQGRVELLLSAPVSWTRLVAGRLVALGVGVGVVVAGGFAGLLLGAWSVDGTLDPAALGRLFVSALAFGAALGAVAAITVSALRTRVAVSVLASLVLCSYVLSYLVPMLGWPEWLNRLSVFWAFGHPYLAWPSAAMWTVLVALAGPGSGLAAFIAERTPKVA